MASQFHVTLRLCDSIADILMCFAINRAWEGYDLSFLKTDNSSACWKSSQVSAAVRTKFTMEECDGEMFQSVHQIANMSHGSQSSWAKKMGKKELVTNTLYRPAKSRRKNWGKPSVKLLPFDDLENS